MSLVFKQTRVLNSSQSFINSDISQQINIEEIKIFSKFLCVIYSDNLFFFVWIFISIIFNLHFACMLAFSLEDYNIYPSTFYLRYNIFNIRQTNKRRRKKHFDFYCLIPYDCVYSWQKKSFSAIIPTSAATHFL